MEAPGRTSRGHQEGRGHREDQMITRGYVPSIIRFTQYCPPDSNLYHLQTPKWAKPELGYFPDSCQFYTCLCHESWVLCIFVFCHCKYRCCPSKCLICSFILLSFWTVCKQNTSGWDLSHLDFKWLSSLYNHHATRRTCHHWQDRSKYKKEQVTTDLTPILGGILLPTKLRGHDLGGHSSKGRKSLHGDGHACFNFDFNHSCDNHEDNKSIGSDGWWNRFMDYLIQPVSG